VVVWFSGSVGGGGEGAAALAANPYM